MNKIPVYNCIIEEKDELTGIYAISFVDYPANEVDFIALNKNNPVFLSKDTKKQILTGVVLKPEQLIYRNSPDIGDYYIKFSAGEIEKISQKMMKTGLALNCTTHQHQSQLKGNYLVELWTIENPELDKSKALGFSDLSKGTLMCSYKIEDSNYWKNEVMTGNVKGFSLEGFFNQVLINNKLKKMSKNKESKTVLQRLKSLFLSAIDEIEKEDTTDSGDTVREFTLKDGGLVTVDEEGLATLNDEPLQAGEHVLADGNILVIDDGGYFVETKEASAKNDDPVEATAKETLSKVNKELARARRKLQKLEEITTEDKDAIIAAQKQMIADLQTLVNDLKSQLKNSVDKAEEVEQVIEEQKTEIAELKKKTPSAAPATPKKEAVKLSEMTHTQRMAHTINLTIQRKKK